MSSEGELEKADGEEPKLPRRITPRFVLPVVAFTLLAQILTMAVTTGYIFTEIQVPEYAPFGNTFEGSVGNAVMLVAVAFFMTLVMVLLVRRRRISLIKRFLTFFVSFAAFFLTLIFSGILLPFIIPYSYASEMALALSVSLGLLVGYSSIRLKSRLLGLASSLILSVEVASYLSIFIRPPTVFMLPAAFAIYDIYAVFKGPLKALITSNEPHILAPLAARLGDLEVGLGDIAFYSTLPSAGLIAVGVGGALVAVAATNAGLIITLRMLRNRRNLPGLPIPILLGTVGLVPFLLMG